MEARDARLVRWLRGVLLGVGLVVFGRLLWVGLIHVNDAVHVLAIGGIMAFVFEPVIRVLDRVFVARAASAAVLAIVLLAVVGGIGGWLGLAAFHEAQALIAALPGFLTQAQNSLPALVNLLKQNGIAFDPNSLIQQGVSRFGSIGRGALTYSVAVVSGLVGSITNLAIGVTIAFYILLDGRRMHEAWRRLLPPGWRPAVAEAETIVLDVLGGFVRGQIVVAVVFGILVGVGMAWLGLPYPLLLGVQAAFFELLPTVGPFIGAIAPLILGLTLPYPHALWVLAYFFGAQQLESTFLVPRISGEAVGLHPIAVIAGILAGFQLDGLTGALLAVPALGVAYALLRRFAAPWSLSGAPKPAGHGAGGRPQAPPKQPRRPAGREPQRR
ncbi:MAG TPA: AI-2E family transporter [Bacillota bacterium]|nr:AI-2E family transporter [Bacillota bacterium]